MTQYKNEPQINVYSAYNFTNESISTQMEKKICSQNRVKNSSFFVRSTLLDLMETSWTEELDRSSYYPPVRMYSQRIREIN